MGGPGLSHVPRGVDGGGWRAESGRRIGLAEQVGAAGHGNGSRAGRGQGARQWPRRQRAATRTSGPRGTTEARGQRAAQAQVATGHGAGRGQRAAQALVGAAGQGGDPGGGRDLGTRRSHRGCGCRPTAAMRWPEHGTSGCRAAHAIRPWTSGPANGAFRVAPVTRDPERCATPLPKRQATQANTATSAAPRPRRRIPTDWGLRAGLGARSPAHDDAPTITDRRGVVVRRGRG